MQSCIKPFQYAVAISNHTSQHVHSYVGKEPSGHLFNAITLNALGKICLLEHRGFETVGLFVQYSFLATDQPHNPMINAGALVICSLLNRELPLADRFVHVSEIDR